MHEHTEVRVQQQGQRTEQPANVVSPSRRLSLLCLRCESANEAPAQAEGGSGVAADGGPWAEGDDGAPCQLATRPSSCRGCARSRTSRSSRAHSYSLSPTFIVCTSRALSFRLSPAAAVERSGRGGRLRRCVEGCCMTRVERRAKSERLCAARAMELVVESQVVDRKSRRSHGEGKKQQPCRAGNEPRGSSAERHWNGRHFLWSAATKSNGHHCGE